MRNFSKLSGVVAAAALVFVALGASTTPSDAKKNSNRLRCDARGAGHIALHARYEERARPKRARKKFNAEFEALAGGAFVAGQHITFLVDSVVVGNAALAAVVGGEVAGELELDTNANAHNGKTPFPSNFPAIGSGSVIEARQAGKTVLACEID